MIEFFSEWITLLMFVSLFLGILSGYPIAFVLSSVGLLFGAIGIALGLIPIELTQAIPERLFGIMKNDTLLAIPFFTCMGLVLERSGVAEELLLAINQILARFRGGLAYGVILVGALLAATTGIVAASVMAIGLISLPLMLKHRYPAIFSSGLIMASGTLAQIIPPSLVLIILADTLSVPIQEMYMGALLPSAILVAFFVIYLNIITRLKPEAFPPITDITPIPLGQLLIALITPLLLIFLVLGTVFIGLATPTQAGAMGALGAMVYAWIKCTLPMRELMHVLDKTSKLTSFVIFILIGSSIFTLTFRTLGGDLWVESLLTSLPGGQTGFLLLVTLLIFILGCFLDFFEIVFIVIPLLLPILHQLEINPTWFGLLIALNLQTSFLTPPFGFSLFYLKSIAPPSITNKILYKSIIPFITIQMLTLALVWIFPSLVLGPIAWKNKQEQSEQVQQLTIHTNGTNSDEAIALMLKIAQENQNQP